MHTRQQGLLKLIIESYIETAEPVGSKFLVAQNNLGVSEATVRNEMRDLEQGGYLRQPHTSAGRIPTEKGYRFFIEHLMGPAQVKRRVPGDVSKFLKKSKAVDEEKKKKMIAVYISERIHATVIVAFGEDKFYCTGTSYLFAQPEFHAVAQTVNMSQTFDHLEEHIGDMYKKVGKKAVSVLMGKDNPLGSDCGSVGVVSTEGELFITLAPMRMDYARHIEMMNYIHKII